MEGPSAAASFEFYEGIRILVPGGIAAALAAGADTTFTGDDFTAPGGALGAVTLALFGGLVLYFLDAPTKTAYFRKDLPHTVLEQWEIPLKAGTRDERNVYFILLDEMIPGAIRARALYYGSIYRIGFESIYLLSGFASGVLVAAAVLEEDVGRREDPDSWAWYLAVAFLIAFTAALLVAARSSSRGPRSPKETLSKVWNSVLDASTGRTGMPIVLAVIVGFVTLLPNRGPLSDATEHWEHWRAFTMSASVAVLWLCGARRHFAGSVTVSKTPATGAGPAAGSKKRTYAPLSAAAVVISMLPALAMTTAAGLRSETLGGAGIGPAPLLAWLAVYLTAVVIAASRGYEKRLGGSYATQATWLKYHEAEVRAEYGVRSTSRHRRTRRA